MSNFFYTDHASPDQIAAMNKQVFSKPEVQQALATYTQRYGNVFTGEKGNLLALGTLQKALRDAGMPGNMRISIGSDGKPQIVDNGGVNWGNIVALGIGGVAGGFALAGATAAPAGDAAASAATDVGADVGADAGVDIAGESADLAGGLGETTADQAAVDAAAPTGFEGGLDDAGNAIADTGADAGTGSDVLPSTQVGTGDGGTLPDVHSSLPPGAGAPSTLDKVTNYLKSKFDPGKAGAAINGATSAAANNRYLSDLINERGLNDYETQLNARAKLEQDQRNQAAKDAYRNSWYQTRQAGPFDPKPLQQPTGDEMNTLATVGKQASDILANPAKYNAATMPDVTKFTASKPGTLETIGDWAGPILSLFGGGGGSNTPTTGSDPLKYLKYLPGLF